MAFQFTDNSLAITFRARFPDNNDPTQTDFEKWDNTQANAWNAVLEEVLPEFPDIDGTDKTTRSNLMMLASLSSGGTRKTKLRSACRYFLRLIEVGIDI